MPKRIHLEGVAFSVALVQGATPDGPTDLKLLSIIEPVSGEVYEVPLEFDHAEKLGQALCASKDELLRMQQSEEARARLALPGQQPLSQKEAQQIARAGGLPR